MNAKVYDLVAKGELTEQEGVVLELILEGLIIPDFWYSTVESRELARVSGLKLEAVKALIHHLHVKGYVYSAHYHGNPQEHNKNVILAYRKGWELHPDWKEEYAENFDENGVPK